MKLATVMFLRCVVVWAAAVNFGQFVDDDAAVVWAAAAVSADTFVLVIAAVILAAVTVWNAVLANVVELPVLALAAVGLTSLACGSVAASFAVQPAYGSAVELVHVPK